MDEPAIRKIYDFFVKEVDFSRLEQPLYLRPAAAPTPLSHSSSSSSSTFPANATTSTSATAGVGSAEDAARKRARN